MHNVRLRRIVVLIGLVIVLAALYRWAPALTGRVETLRHGVWFLFAVWIAFFAVEFIRVLVSAFAVRKWASPWIVAAARDGIPYALIEAARRRRTVRLRYWFLASVWGLGILLLIGALQYTGQLDMMERIFVDEVDCLQTADSTTSVGVFSFSTPTMEPAVYLRGLLQIAQTFDSLGVRELVFEWPSTMTLHPEELALLDSLRNTRMEKLIFSHWNPEIPSRYVRYSERRNDPISPERSFMFTDRVSRAGPGFISWYPEMCDMGISYLDASLAAAGKFRGFPAWHRADCQRGRVVFGDMIIPVTEEGEAISLRLIPPRRAFLSVVAEHRSDPDHPSLDTIVYFAHATGIEYPRFPATLASEVRNKIILISWPQGRSGGRTAYAMANIIESLLHGRVYAQHKRLPMPISGLVVLISALLAAWMRPGRAMLVILFAAIALFGVGIWLLTSWNTILPMAYASLAAILAGMAFPLLKFLKETSFLLSVELNGPSDIDADDHWHEP